MCVWVCACKTPTGLLLCQCSATISLYLSPDPSSPLFLPCCYLSPLPSILYLSLSLTLFPPTSHSHTHKHIWQRLMCACVFVCESIQPLPFLSVLQAPLASHSPLSSICFTLHLCCMPYYSITPSLWLHVSLFLLGCPLVFVSVTQIFFFFFQYLISFTQWVVVIILLLDWWKNFNFFSIFMGFTAGFGRVLHQ